MEISTSIIIELEDGHEELVLLKPVDHIDIQNNSNVKFVFDAAAILWLKEKNREVIHYTLPFLYQYIHYILLREFTFHILQPVIYTNILHVTH